MNASTLLVMIFVLTVVWGGFLIALRMALRKERRKRRAESSSPNRG